MQLLVLSKLLSDVCTLGTLQLVEVAFIRCKMFSSLFQSKCSSHEVWIRFIPNDFVTILYTSIGYIYLFYFYRIGSNTFVLDTNSFIIKSTKFKEIKKKKKNLYI